MIEQGRQLGFDFKTPEVHQEGERTELSNVPSDDNSPFLLNLTMHSAAFGDVWIYLQDTRWRTNPDDAKLFPHIRFRSSYGGGLNPLVSEELSRLPRSFQNEVRLDEAAYYKKEFGIDSEGDRINSNSSLEIIRKKGEAGFKVKNLQDDDEEFGTSSKFIDLEVTTTGDVILTQRFIRKELDGNTWFPVEFSGQMLFKSRENGGKFPMINGILKSLAERIANAKDPRKK